ncbi:MAG: tRNA pseudouridine(55) synthase TruB [Gammaproteobacteria bacterium]|nr:tRNA pseudouridine(55) synthase TruB [Gammaproteobacteria bacterium]
MSGNTRASRGFTDVNGILLLNKPLGISSNKALQAARNLFKANKAGHTGSLDPMATGLLPVCFGEATKYSGYLLESSKKYRAICKLGITTTTGDSEGEILSEKPVQVSPELVQQLVAGFVGKIEQIPPMYSAVKHQGERLYKLARQGIEVERKSREIEIYSLQLLALEKDLLTLDIHCSKGTYIRTLAEDIGEQLGCGAYLFGLERTGVQPFWDARAYTLDELRTISDQSHIEGNPQLLDCLLTIDAALCEWPQIDLTPDMSFYMSQGQAVQVPQAPTEGLVRLYDPNSKFIGLGHILADGRVAPKRMLSSK